jgi:RNA polymerase sigma-70 factor (ECF subfamily)
MGSNDATIKRRDPAVALTHAGRLCYGRPTVAAERSDEEWLRALRERGARSDAAQDLGRYLRRGLQKALAGRSLRSEDLDDFTQDALVRIIENVDGFRGDSRFTTWALAIATRVAFTALRRRRHPADAWNTLEADFIEALPAASTAETDPTRRLERRSLLDVLSRAIVESLTPRQRTAILGELEGMGSEQLAAHLGVERNALYKLHHDARKKLKTTLLAAGFTAQDVRDELERGA